jgi:hypothetical protein
MNISIPKEPKAASFQPTAVSQKTTSQLQHPPPVLSESDPPGKGDYVGDNSHYRLDTFDPFLWEGTFAHRIHRPTSGTPTTYPDLQDPLPLPALSKKYVYEEIDLMFFAYSTLHKENISELGKQEIADFLSRFEERVRIVTLDVLAAEEEKQEKEKPPPNKQRERWTKSIASLQEQKRMLRRRLRNTDSAENRKVLSKLRLKVVRTAHKLQHKLIKLDKWIAKKNDMNCFKRDRWKYAKEILHDSQNTGKPTFTAEAATNYFRSTYQDEKRSHLFAPRPEMVRPDLPTVPFNIEPPTNEEWAALLYRKRVRSSPGLNGIPYRLYKGCPKIFSILVSIYNRIWQLHKAIPSQWRFARTIMLAKTETLDDPSKFRPISVTNSESRLFWSLSEKRTTQYFVTNNYHKPHEQKGFIPNISGCLEHSELCAWMLALAKRHRKPICALWIDLRNAYGSIKHGLIQFALQWYHVPDAIQELFHAYYEQLWFKIFTSAWTSDWIPFDIGAFQGCTVSTSIFNMVFALILDMIRVEAPEELRFASNDPEEGEPITVSQLAYADDLTALRDSPELIQKVACVLTAALDWTLTMAAKPSKCISFAHGHFRQFMKTPARPLPERPWSKVWECPTRGEVTVTQRRDTDFDTFDPKILIAGVICPYLGDDPSNKGFKMLGQWLEEDLKDHQIRKRTEAKLIDKLERVDRTLLSGPAKAWIYDKVILAMLSWEFMIYEFPPTILNEWELIATQYIKKWLGLLIQGHNGVLHRFRSNQGLALRQLSVVAKKMQVTKKLLLEASTDPNILALRHHLTRDELKSQRWSTSKALKTTEGEAFVRRITQNAQSGRGGVGLRSGRFKKSDDAMWKTIFADLNDEKWQEKAYGLVVAGAYLAWEGRTHYLADQLTLEAGIGRPGPQVFKFLINAISGTNCTAANHHKWFGSSRSCHLCQTPLPGLRHILGACQVALEQGRFTWRHDSVLSALLHLLSTYFEAHNKSKPAKKSANQKPYHKVFVAAGAPLPRRVTSPNDHPFCKASDWRVAADLAGSDYDFNLFSTSARRPDILIWSERLKRLLIVELTVPCEENITSWHAKKRERYTPDAEHAQSCGWDVDILPIEVGARGFVAKSFLPLLKAINYPHVKRKSLLDQISRIALECSTIIYTQRHAPVWKLPSLRT